MKKEPEKSKSEICILRSNLYLLLEGSTDKSMILKASMALDKAILKYMKSVKS